jgi:CheY-like chemotaxis protein
MLSQIGVGVTVCNNGQEAVERVRDNAFDIVFMDIRMPVLDGEAAAQRIWEFTDKQTTKIVAVSASVMTHQQADYLSIGFDAFIGKPFLADEIYICLANLLLEDNSEDFFEYDDSPVEALDPLELTTVALPEEQILQLKEAAELHDISVLMATTEDITAQGGSGARLAMHLSKLISDLDMEGILALLHQFSPTDEPPNAEGDPL